MKIAPNIDAGNLTVLMLYTYSFWRFFELTVTHSSVLMVFMFLLGMAIAALVSAMSSGYVPVDDCDNLPDAREAKSNPSITDVWSHNLEDEFLKLGRFVEQCEDAIIGIDTKPKQDSYPAVRQAVLGGTLQQLGIALRHPSAAKPETHVWQFQLQTKQDWQDGAISVARMRKSLAEVSLSRARWVAFGGVCDFAFLLYTICGDLPEAYAEYEVLLAQFFPRVADLKYLLPTSTLRSLAAWLRLPYGKPWSAGSQAQCTLHCFLALDKHLQHNAFCEPTVRRLFVELGNGVEANCGSNSEEDLGSNSEEAKSVPMRFTCDSGAEARVTGQDTELNRRRLRHQCGSQPTGVAQEEWPCEGNETRGERVDKEWQKSEAREWFDNEHGEWQDDARKAYSSASEHWISGSPTSQSAEASYQRSLKWLGGTQDDIKELMDWVVSSIAKSEAQRVKLRKE